MYITDYACPFLVRGHLAYISVFISVSSPDGSMQHWETQPQNKDTGMNTNIACLVILCLQ